MSNKIGPIGVALWSIGQLTTWRSTFHCVSTECPDLKVVSIVAVVGDSGGGSSSRDVFGKLQEQMSHHVTKFIN